MAEAEFLRPGGMLAWLSNHLLEMKVEGQRGSPPRLQDNPRRWFEHFDYDGRGSLTKPELLRGVAKAYDVSALATPSTPARRARTVGVNRLREIVDAVWDEARWKDGISLAEFDSPSGLAQRLLAALPEESKDGKRTDARLKTGTILSVRSADGEALSVEEALERARAEDLKVREEDQLRAQERAERQRQAFAAIPPPGVRARQGQGRQGNEPGRAGAELLLASLLEAAREGNRSQAPTIRIQCPFCSAVNAARAAAGHRVICGGCRSVFAVPSNAGVVQNARPSMRP